MLYLGNRFGKLVVVGACLEKSTPSRKYYVVQCDCGIVKSTRECGLKSGETKTCGCGKKLHGLKHGHRRVGSRDRTYQTWDGMVQRCTNENSPMYRYYGGKGISVAERWLNFSKFLSDMGERPENRSLERLDNDKPYSKENCVWASKLEQMRNTSRVIRVVFEGKLQPLGELARRYGIAEYSARYRVKAGWTIEKVLEIK